MIGYFRSSLLLRAGLAMGLVTALALGGMASAVYMARSTHGQAAAVNQAGSLRMQSYQIAAAMEASGNGNNQPFGDIEVLVEEFDQRLNHSRLTDVVGNTSRASILQGYQLVTDQWVGTILPLLHGYAREKNESSATALLNETRAAYRASVTGFVADIDKLVHLLEDDAESRIHLLGLFQTISLFLTLTVAITTLYLLQVDVLGPLHELLNATERARRGDFNAQVSHTGSDELGQLGQTFNNMAEDLSKMYSDLEQRVEEKTRELTQRNQSLELLYTATQSLAEAPVSEPTYRKLLDDIGQVVDIKGITLCKKDNSNNHAYRVASSGPTPPMCKTENCVLCLGDGQTRQLGGGKQKAPSRILSVPVSDQNDNNGVLLVETDRETELETWQIRLLEILGKHIGISLDAAQLIAQTRRLALLEERSVIARELHDSLAQSLTYLKIQVARLSILLDSESKKAPVAGVLAELKQGLESAYRQLRELLTTFRLQMDGTGLATALAKTVDEFNVRGKLVITLDNALTGSSLSVNDEIHVLQIVREALSNVVHHSRANHAWVKLAVEHDHSILVSIEDNGIGIPDKAERAHHYGLAIMIERASTLRGELQIQQRSEGGTRVTLRFRPETGEQSSLTIPETSAT